MIDSNRPRIPAASNPLGFLWRSQSCADFYTKLAIFSVMKVDLASLDVTDGAVPKEGLSFFISESESKNQKNDKEKQFLASAGKRRMSL